MKLTIEDQKWICQVLALHLRWVGEITAGPSPRVHAQNAARNMERCFDFDFDDLDDLGYEKRPK